MQFLTILDTDKIILNMLNDTSLFIITQVSKNIRNIILNDLVLNRRFIKYKSKYLKIMKIIKSQADCYGHNKVRIIDNSNDYTRQCIKELIPEAKQIKIIYPSIIFNIHPNKVLTSIEILVNLYHQFDMQRVDIYFGTIEYRI